MSRRQLFPPSFVVVMVMLLILACGAPTISKPQATMTPIPTIPPSPIPPTPIPTAIPPTTVPSAGEISQFATRATASSEYSNPSWSAMQASGAPDTLECGDTYSAWASSSSSGVDWLLLTYDTSIIPTRIVIYQTYNPSAVSLVEVADQAGNYYTVYEATPVVVDTCPYQMEIAIQGVNVPVNTIRITVDQSNSFGWNEIDAVQLIGLPNH